MKIVVHILTPKCVPPCATLAARRPSLGTRIESAAAAAAAATTNVNVKFPQTKVEGETVLLAALPHSPLTRSLGRTECRYFHIRAAAAVANNGLAPSLVELVRLFFADCSRRLCFIPTFWRVETEHGGVKPQSIPGEIKKL